MALLRGKAEKPRASAPLSASMLCTRGLVKGGKSGEV
jgi:hypothetical protein